MPFISVTRVRIRSARFLLPFFWYSLLSLVQAKLARGNLKTRTLHDADRAFWTLTAWESADAMRAYVESGSHRRAVPKLLEWCDEASTAHWEQASAELPQWREAHRRMVEEGRPSKVNHPSPRQTAREIRAPQGA